MLSDRGDLPTGQTVPFFFPTYDSPGGSVTITGLAVTDIEVYKGVSMTQRASDNGYALVDTDGIDLDSRTGIHGFSIDMSDNSDAGFWAVGSFYHVVVDAITVDSQTVRFIFLSAGVQPAACNGRADAGGRERRPRPRRRQGDRRCRRDRPDSRRRGGRRDPH